MRFSHALLILPLTPRLGARARPRASRGRKSKAVDGGLIAGHARILAARQLGIAEIPVMVAAGWWRLPVRAGTRSCCGLSLAS